MFLFPTSAWNHMLSTDCHNIVSFYTSLPVHFSAFGNDLSVCQSDIYARNHAPVISSIVDHLYLDQFLTFPVFGSRDVCTLTHPCFRKNQRRILFEESARKPLPPSDDIKTETFKSSLTYIFRSLFWRYSFSP